MKLLGRDTIVWQIAVGLCSFFMVQAECVGQFNMIDLGSFKREHLVTNPALGQTADLNIYLSAPNWFARSAGYCAVSFRIVPQKGLVFKSSGVLRVYMETRYWNDDGPTSYIDIPIEQGESQAKAELLVNLLEVQNSYQSAKLHATWNGRALRGHNSWVQNSARIAAQSGRDLIVITKASSQSDRKRLDALAEMAETGNWFSQTEYVSGSGSVSSYADATRFPTNWLYLSCLDQISISLEDMAELSEAALECLNHFVLAGGILEINRVQNVSSAQKFIPVDLRRRFDGIAEKKGRSGSRLLAPVQMSDLESDFDLFDDTVWDRLINRHARDAFNPSNTITRPQVFSQNRSLYQPVDVIDAADFATRKALEIGTTYLDFRFRNTEVMASRLYDVTLSQFARDPGVEESLASAVSVTHGFGVVRLEPRSRRDSSSLVNELQRGAVYLNIKRNERFQSGIGDDFWKWLIPSVGRTPVVPFLMFVTLFAGMVVPGLLIWCNRHKRRVWMVVFMPAMALFFTSLLFAYGIFKDGLGNVGRIRSLSFVNQQGDGIAWSRQSYFAARVPPQGVRLSKESQLVPLLVNTTRELGRVMHTEVGEHQTYFGILPPRAQSQFAVVHPLRKQKFFERMDERDPTLGSQGIRNTSGFDWSLAVFTDRAGRAFAAENISDQSRPDFEEVSAMEAMQRIQKAYNARPLQEPLDAPTGDQISLNQFFAEVFSFNRFRSNSSGQIFEEDCWAANLGMSGKSSSNEPMSFPTRMGHQFSPMPPIPGTFILFSEQVHFLEQCVPDAKTDDGLHTVIGYW